MGTKSRTFGGRSSVRVFTLKSLDFPVFCRLTVHQRSDDEFTGSQTAIFRAAGAHFRLAGKTRSRPHSRPWVRYSRRGTKVVPARRRIGEP
jgi:hypothetical protein